MNLKGVFLNDTKDKPKNTSHLIALTLVIK